MRTNKIYERDSYISEFDATVLACCEAKNNCYEIILDSTAFFPEGGGQKSDVGMIGAAKVYDVQIVDDEIIHYAGSGVAVGEKLHCSIDWKLRFSRMQNHSAEHILCGLIHNRFGYDNSGFHIDGDEVTFDMNGPMTGEEIAEIELLANKVVYENVPIIISFPAPEELANLSYRSKLDLTEGVRLVTIEGYDVCACCAPHVARTGDIGVIKIIDSFPHRGGVRFVMKAGESALADYIMLDSNAKRSMAVLSAKRCETAEFTAELSRKNRELATCVVELKNEITRLYTQKAIAKLNSLSEEEPALLIFTEGLDEVQMRNIINECTLRTNRIVGGFMGNDEEGYRFIISRNKAGEGIALPALAKKMREEINAQGGGSDLMIQGKIALSQNETEQFFKLI